MHKVTLSAILQLNWRSRQSLGWEALVGMAQLRKKRIQPK